MGPAVHSDVVRERLLAARGFVFDMDGTLVLGDRHHHGLSPLPGALEITQWAARRGRPFVVFTNGTTRTPAQLAGVIGVLVWCMVIESILGGSVSAIRAYLPYTAATTLGGAKLGAGAFGPGYSVSSQGALPFLGAAALIAAIAIAISLLAERTTVRHDIT